MSQSTSSIVNGQLIATDPAVVSIAFQGQTYCTGTVVSPRVVLTAAHCIIGDPGITDSQIVVGSSVTARETRFFDVTTAVSHPQWIDQDNSVTDDIGLVFTKDSIPVEPVALPPRALSSENIGDTVRVLGYGFTTLDGSDAGDKRQGLMTVRELFDTVLIVSTLESATCSGDSGGPAFLQTEEEEILVGVHTRSDCDSGGFEEQIFPHIENFIKPTIETTVAECAADGQCTDDCPVLDPDCVCATNGICGTECEDPFTDKDCLAELCVADDECIAECGDIDPDCADKTAGKNSNDGCMSSQPQSWLPFAILLLARFFSIVLPAPRKDI